MLVVIFIVLGTFLILRGVKRLQTDIGIEKTREEKRQRSRHTCYGILSLAIGIGLVWLSQTRYQYHEWLSPLFLIIGITVIPIGVVFLAFAITASSTRDKNGALIFLGAFLLDLGLLILWIPSRHQDIIRDILLVDTNQILLVILSLIIGGMLYRWTIDPRREERFSTVNMGGLLTGPWSLLSLVAILFIIVLIGPYIPNLANRLTGIKTPLFEAQLQRSSIQREEIAIYADRRTLFPLIKSETLTHRIQRNIMIATLHKLALELRASEIQEQRDERQAVEKQLKLMEEFKILIEGNSLKEFLDKADEASCSGEYELRKQREKANEWIHFLRTQGKFARLTFYKLLLANLKAFAGYHYDARLLLEKALKDSATPIDQLTVRGPLATLMAYSKDRTVGEVETIINHWEEVLHNVYILQTEIPNLYQDIRQQPLGAKKLSGGPTQFQKIMDWEPQMKEEWERQELAIKNELARVTP